MEKEEQDQGRGKEREGCARVFRGGGGRSQGRDGNCTFRSASQNNGLHFRKAKSVSMLKLELRRRRWRSERSDGHDSQRQKTPFVEISI